MKTIIETQLAKHEPCSPWATASVARCITALSAEHVGRLVDDFGTDPDGAQLLTALQSAAEQNQQ